MTDTPTGSRTRVTHGRIRIALEEPFVSNRGVITHVEQTVLRLDWQGWTGYGTALAADAEELAACAPLLADAGPYDLHRVLDALRDAGGPADRGRGRRPGPARPARQGRGPAPAPAASPGSRSPRPRSPWALATRPNSCAARGSWPTGRSSS